MNFNPNKIDPTRSDLPDLRSERFGYPKFLSSSKNITNDEVRAGRRIACRNMTVVLSALFCLLLSDFAHSAEDPLTIGIFPRRNAKVTIDLFSPLAKHLSTNLNREVNLETSKNFETFWDAVKNRRYDIVHFNQYHYVVSRHKYGYRVFAKNEEFGEATIAGSILVRRDSGINSVRDLKGKIVLFGGGPRAMQSYIVASYLLQEAGLPKQDYVERFAKNPPNAILSTYYGLASAAGAGDKVLKLDVVKKQIDIKQMKYLLRGEQLPHLPWATKRGMDPALRRKIKALFINLGKSKDGQVVIKKAKLTGLVSASDREFDKHRAIIKSVLGEEY